MKRTYLALMMVAGTLVGGCSDDRGPFDPTRPGVTQVPVHQTIIGTVVGNSEHRILPGLLLLLEDGSELGLDGSEAAALGSVIGAQVQVEGTMDGDVTLAVERFVVLAVGGSPVLDGILESADDGVYTLDLMTGGRRSIIDPPAELIAHLGQRVWVILTQDDGGGAMSFGVISSTT